MALFGNALRVVLFVLAVAPLSLCAQTNDPLAGFGVEVNALSGKIIRHTQKFTSPVPPLSNALDVNFVWQTYGKKDWQQRRGFPVVGVGITFTDYGNNAIYGRCVGIYPNLQIPIISGKDLEWTFRLGNGLGYVTRRYNPNANEPMDTANSAVSSHFNDFAIFMTDLRYSYNDHWQFQLGANFTHISNADYSEPNLGINMLGGHVGVRYFPTCSKPKRIVRDLEKLPNRWLLQGRASISYKKARAAGNPVCPSYFAAGYLSRRWLGKNKLFIGMDYAYHGDVYAFLKNYGVHIGHERSHSWDGAVFVGNEFIVGRVGLVTQVGYYYRQTFLKFDDIYQKIGGNVYIVQREKGPIKEVFVSGLLLTHFVVAQLAEFGIGFGI
ncbi:MAG: secreted protein [Flavipsychrobacter sp.]|jgi:hypothetical protein|nr:secreted protein [Flavipsychrobacter sp.]